MPTAGAAHPLLATREAQMVRAALAVTLDGSDTLALTELVTLLDDHGAHQDWFAQLTAAPDRDARRAVFASWWDDDVLSGLREVRRACIGFTPVEMISALIDALDLPQRIKRWSGQGARRRTLDALRALAHETTERRRAEGSPITLTGLRSELDAWEGARPLRPARCGLGGHRPRRQGPGMGPRHHLSRGPPPKERDHSSGVLVASPGALDVTAPLSGRSLRFWPKVAAPGEVVADLATSAFATRRRDAEAEESGRVHYVALTRAARTSVLAVPGAATVLDSLIQDVDGTGDGMQDGVHLVSWSDDEIAVHGTAAPLPATVTAVNVDELLEEEPQRLPPSGDPLAASDVPLRPSGETSARVTGRFQASAVGSDDALGEVLEPQSIGPVLVHGGGQRWERVGEAVHAYLALPLEHLSAQQRTAAAERLLQRWVVTRTVGAQVLLDAGEAWARFLAAEFPGAEQLTEQPITWWNEDSQVMEGWIDTLLRLPDGSIVLVDHKTYPGDDPVGHVRREYLGQMATYARALAASGTAPDRILVHLPLRGQVVEVRLHDVVR